MTKARIVNSLDQKRRVEDDYVLVAPGRDVSARVLRIGTYLSDFLRHFLHSGIVAAVSPDFSSASGYDLSRLVHQRAARKRISDARIATYVIFATGSGPGGRVFTGRRSRADRSGALLVLRVEYVL
jgi:hypothetical protein